jgi:hypothetical protein
MLVEGNIGELGVYKETLKKLYLVYIEQQKYIEVIKIKLWVKVCIND